MSAYLVPELWCDGKGCADKVFADGETTLIALRQTARDGYGWTRRWSAETGRFEDYCPAHEAPTAARAVLPMAESCSSCGHIDASHRYEPGFYDVRGQRTGCTVLGCPCVTYRPTLKTPDNASRPEPS